MTQKSTDLRPKIALFEPDIPQNTAAIIRTCACLGAKLEIIEPCGYLLTDKRFKRVVMDYIEEENIKFHKSFNEFLASKKNHRIIRTLRWRIKKLKEEISYLQLPMQ